MSFITIDKLNGSSGETISTITVPEYQGLEDRTQSFKVVVDGKEVFVNVQQKAFKPSLETNKQVVPFTQEVLTQSLQITSNFNWEARTDSSWFTLSQTEGNKGTTTIEISTSSIDSPSENRNGIINFYFGDTFVTAITVKQEFEVIFEVSTTSIDMTDETTATINVTSNVDWYCNTDITWINLDIVQGFGDKTITVTAQEFTGQDRNGFINFYVGGELKKSVNIYQTSFVEPPSDVENCFYIEPYNEGETITVRINGDYLTYFEKGEWKNMYGDGRQISTNKRLYIKKIPFSHSIYGLFSIGGNIETLLGEMKEDYAFELFRNDSNLVDASNLILPATTLAESCYSYMFTGCSRLINAPVLPATTLANSCYMAMFAGCENLVNAPVLPATTLATSCYYYMFGGCTSLVESPELPATTLAEMCYREMFAGCENLVNASALPATTLAEECYREMFWGCTSLTIPPKISATTLAYGCCERMFSWCSSLEKSPVLLAETLEDNSYDYMFYGCEKLNNITMLATNNIVFESFAYWVDGVSPTGTFTKKQGVDIPSGTSGIPKGWTVVEVP